MTTHAEAIKTLEAMRTDLAMCEHGSDTVEFAALTLAIAALKVAEWLKSNLEYELHWFYAGVKFTPDASQNGYTPVLRSWKTGAEISAPTLSELAAKLQESP